MAFVLVAVSAAGYLYLKHLEGNVSTTDVGSAGKKGFSKDEAFNILIIGTDKHRQGQRGLRRQGQRRARRHQHPAARLQGPYERDRVEHPA